MCVRISMFQVSELARDLIRKFLSEASARLGNRGADEVKAHPFFVNDKWTFATLKDGDVIATIYFLSSSPDCSRIEKR